MDDYVAKPIEPEELMATLARYLQSQGEQGPTLHSVGGEWEFPMIHGLDPKAGLRQVAHNAGLYRKLLPKGGARRRGRRNPHRAVGRISTRRPGYNLKGVAANLGAIQIALQATDLEKRLQGRALESVEGPLGLLERTMDRLCPGAEGAGGRGGAGAKEAPTVDWSALSPQVEAIRPLLESDLEQAMELAEQLLERYAGVAELGDPLRRLQDALQSFDTDAAGESLDQIAERVSAYADRG